ncbi:YicC/YloC family endoribonuclease [Candidatus Vallotia cooleyia]|uniref:YicC/YloC family endoribonuclease n=1 Tax=Candidatus Vallotiella adelgis TaxID=1177211 RepID=UPI001D00E23D|nr:YicC/YloC family endoribonuclease [Candidatus Vallotia cooleyia]UDG82085.1 hypothetical protein GJV44_00325 [Candidatus Vallotia cooleyia]
MIFSMTGYANVTRELVIDSASEIDGSTHMTSISIELRTVNSRFLDLNFRMPEEVRTCEPMLRRMLVSRLSRGKVDIRINVQRSSEQVTLAGSLNRDALLNLATLERFVRNAFPSAGSLHVGEILRWPGVIVDSGLSAALLHKPVLACSKQALDELVNARSREGSQLVTILLANVAEMEEIISHITPLMPELVACYQHKIAERLKAALNIAVLDGSPQLISYQEIAERIRQEVIMYGIRIDIAEELSRLGAHLAEIRHLIGKGGRVGKQLDFIMQELNREANTLGSKAASKELADASIRLKLLIEQMREQVQNLE